MVDRVHPGNVGVAAALAVDQECLAGEAVPQVAHQPGELGGARVALLRIGHRVQAEVLVALQRGDDVPAGAAVADPVQRLQLPGHHVGRIERGGDRRHQADPRGFAGDRGKQYGGIQAGEAGAGLQHVQWQAADVRAKHEVEVGGFGAPGDVDGEIAAEDAFDIAVGAPPGIAAEPGGGQRHADVQAFRGTHRANLLYGLWGWAGPARGRLLGAPRRCP